MGFGGVDEEVNVSEYERPQTGGDRMAEARQSAGLGFRAMKTMYGTSKFVEEVADKYENVEKVLIDFGK